MHEFVVVHHCSYLMDILVSYSDVYVFYLSEGPMLNTVAYGI